MEINTIIVDDEMDGRIVLEHHLSKNCKNINIVGSFSNVNDAVTFFKSNSIDLLFLDINMPEKNGFDLLEELGTHNCQVIFVTAYDQYAIKAIKYAAFDYLLKPIDPEELIKAVQRLEETTYNEQKTGILLNNLQEKKSDQIALPTKEGYSFLNIHEIIRCEGDSNYCKIYMSQGEKHIATKTLKTMQELLPSDIFFRVHKSNLININFVKKYNKSPGNTLTLQDESEIEVSRRNKEAFLSKMKNL